MKNLEIFRIKFHNLRLKNTLFLRALFTRIIHLSFQLSTSYVITFRNFTHANPRRYFIINCMQRISTHRMNEYIYFEITSEEFPLVSLGSSHLRLHK